jgi:hypothetical protein
VRGSNPEGAEIFRTRLDRSWGRPASPTMGTGSFPALERQRRGFNHPSPRGGAQVKKNSRTIPLLPFTAFMACSRANSLPFLLSSKRSQIYTRLHKVTPRRQSQCSVFIQLQSTETHNCNVAVGEVPIKLTMDGIVPFFVIQDSNWGPLGASASYFSISQVCDVACPSLFLIQQLSILKLSSDLTFITFAQLFFQYASEFLAVVHILTQSLRVRS